MGARVRGRWGGTPVVGVVAGLVVVLLVGGVLGWRAIGPHRTYSVSLRQSRQASADPVAAARALTGLVGAVRDRDTSAARSLAPGADPTAATLLQAVVDNARALDVVDFTARFVDQDSDVAADGTWTADVDLAWRFAGFDQQPVREEIRVTFRDPAGTPTGGSATDRVGITGFGGGTDRSPLWLSGPLQVRRSADTLVLATTSADADLLAERAARAVTVVDRVVKPWPGRLVVEVPGSEEQLDRALGADQGTYAAIAAVTASVDGSTTTGSPVHIFVNPTLYDVLDPVGGQVVLSHETTHLATDAPLTAGLPSWLVEGFADYVALRDVHLPLSTTAGQILAQVRSSGVPDHLPASNDFDEHATHLGATYEAAWLVCRTLADAGGEPALVRLYQQVSAGMSLDVELRRLFGLTETQLLHRWQQRLTRLAAGPGTAQ